MITPEELRAMKPDPLKLFFETYQEKMVEAAQNDLAGIHCNLLTEETILALRRMGFIVTENMVYDQKEQCNYRTGWNVLWKLTK